MGGVFMATNCKVQLTAFPVKRSISVGRKAFANNHILAGGFRTGLPLSSKLASPVGRPSVAVASKRQVVVR